MYKYLLLLSIITISVLSCYGVKKNPISENDKNITKETASQNIILLDDNLENEVKSLNLSDAISSIDIIPLELTNKSEIRDIYNVGITEDDVVITFYRQLLHFSRNGKFLNEIGRLGNGPKEYQDTYFCMITPSRKEVHVLYGNGVKVYSFDGEFKKEAININYEKLFSGIEGRIYSYSDFVFLHQRLPILTPAGEFWSVALVDSTYNIQKKYDNPDFIGRYSEMEKEENRPNMSYLKNQWIEQFINEDYYGNLFKIKYDAIDTIYQFNVQNLTFDPVYSLELGKRPSFEMSHSWLKDPAFFKYLWIYDFYDSKDYLYFLAGKDDMVYTIQYNKTNKEIKVRKDKSTIRENKFPSGHTTITHRRLERQFKLKNDISGGVDFTVDYKIPGGYWVSVNQPSDLLEKINIEELKKADVKDKAARDKLVQVLSNLSEEDNPVLIIAKVK